MGKNILKDVKRVLIIRCGALGDLVYSTVVIDSLIKQYGEDIVIDFICTPASAKLFDKDCRVNRVFLLKHRKPPIWLSPSKMKIVKASNDEPYDLAINLEHGKQFYSLLKAVNAKSKIGAPFTSPRVEDSKKHAVDYIKNMYESVIEDTILDKSYPKVLGDEASHVKNKFDLPDEYIVFNPSNSHNKRHRLNYRAWPKQSWKGLLDLVSLDKKVVIIASRGEDEYFKEIRPFGENVVDLIGKTTITELIGIVKHAAAIVTTDTGPAHIASATNTPEYVLIGPTPVETTGPYKTDKNEVHIISAENECAPCYNTPTMKACLDNICMKEISVKSVYSRLKPILGKN